MAINTEKAALLVMDVQPNIAERLANKDEYLNKLKTTVNTAHKYRMPVIYVVVGFRPGFPEANPNSQMFRAIKGRSASGMVNPAPVIAPTDTDIVVTKRRVSAFSGSDLEVILRAQNIRHLVLTGISTSGVILSTIREAADKDYRLTVLSDLCAEADNEVQRVLTQKVFPRQAEVITSSEWLRTIKSAPRN